MFAEFRRTKLSPVIRSFLWSPLSITRGKPTITINSNQTRLFWMHNNVFFFFFFCFFLFQFCRFTRFNRLPLCCWRVKCSTFLSCWTRPSKDSQLGGTVPVCPLTLSFPFSLSLSLLLLLSPFLFLPPPHHHHLHHHLLLASHWITGNTRIFQTFSPRGFHLGGAPVWQCPIEFASIDCGNVGKKNEQEEQVLHHHYVHHHHHHHFPEEIQFNNSTRRNGRNKIRDGIR